MNSHALEVLEYRQALDVVAAFAASGIGAAAVRGIRPIEDEAGVRSELGLVAEGMALIGDGGWVMLALPDLRDALAHLSIEGYGWDGPTLRQAVSIIGVCRSMRRLILPVREGSPGLGAIVDMVGDFPEISEEIDRAVGEDGAVRDRASPALARLRREIHGARARIVSKLTDYAASLPPHYQVSDGSVSIRDGRYVVPVRREARGEVGGIVHGESQTGATLFVEPPVAIEMMNRLRELEAAEAREVRRILRELTDALRPHADEFSRSLVALVRLDTIYARSRYAISVDGHPPEILPLAQRAFAIVQGRHPLLLAKGDPVVPFDLWMEEGERTLIISGPNTGGKTVLL
ncbi:MAG TPA: hypothetical protein VM534_08260, partial [Thermoanaerobaculia bacterium]|nr:hypothetical protein [Thermoanaerobaculia bacterium]